MTKLYDLEPRDPIVLGDGRSIGENTMTASLDLPYPSTLAGLVRTSIGRRADGTFARDRIDELLAQSLTGPLLRRAEPDPMLFVPAPADAVFFEEEEAKAGTPIKPLVRRRLAPRDLNPGELTDLPADLKIVGLTTDEVRKPRSGPRFWTWTHLEQWLAGSDDGPAPADLGLEALEHEERVHVALKPDTRTALDGALFRTDGVRFVRRRPGAADQLERFDLRFGWTGSDVPTGVVGLGGERRLSVLRRAPASDAFPKFPSEILKLIEKTRRVRLVLLTPAIFDLGFRPTSFEGSKLVACAVGRAVVVSGWDHAKNPASHPDADPPRGAPKPSRRCAAAGSVYWLELDASVKDVKAWVEAHWFKNISSNDQDRRDGFGLAVVGVG